MAILNNTINMENQWTFDDISGDNFVIDMEQQGGKDDHNDNDNSNTGGTSCSLSANSNQSDQQWLQQLRQAPQQQAPTVQPIKGRKQKSNKAQSKPCIVLDSDGSPQQNNNNQQATVQPNTMLVGVRSLSVQELQQQLNKLQQQLKPQQHIQQSQTLQGPMPYNILPLNKKQDPQMTQFKEKLFSDKPKTYPKLTEKNFQKIMKTAMKLKSKVERYMAGY